MLSIWCKTLRRKIHEKSSQEHVRASGRNGAGRRNADPRRLANAVEDAQPRKLETMLEIQGADTVESTTDYFVWFDLELGALKHWLTT